MRFIDWFAGIGGFRRGLELAGHKCVGFCEWDKFATASYTSMHLITDEQRERLATMPLKQRQKEILKNEYRNREWYAPDIRYVRADDVPDAECWCFGAPCQDFSVAGKRAGLDGDRSSLVREIFRLVREKGEENKPEWLIYENVKGMLSSNRGFDFLAILLEMDELGYDIEWQLFNTKNFGIPQNRERVYVVGHKRSCGQKNIFPLRSEENGNCEIERVYQMSQNISRDKRLFQDIFSSRQATSHSAMQILLQRLQQEIQEGTSRSISEIGEEVRQFTEGNLQEIKAEYQRTQSENIGEEFCGVVSIPTEEMLLLWAERRGYAQSQRCIQQQSQSINDRSNGFIERVRRGEYGSLLLAVQSYKGRLFYSIGDGGNWENIYSKEVGKCTLSSILEPKVSEKYFLSAEQMEKIVFQSTSSDTGTDTEETHKSSLRVGGVEALDTAAGGGRGHHTTIPIMFGIDYNKGGKEREISNTITTRYSASQAGNRPGNGAAVCIPVSTPDRAEKRQNGRRMKDNGDEAFTLTSQDIHGVALKIKEATSKGYAEAQEGDSINLSVPESKTRRGRVGKGVANTLDTSCEQGVPVVWYDKYNCYIAIRKLTPKECFRLQGWTDDYFDKAEFVNSDSQLYKQAGNGVTVNVVYEIGKALR